MEKNKLKCALIGYGYWGKIIERYIKKNPSYELMAICDPQYPNSETLQNILTNELIQAAFVCSPIATHYDVVKSALEHGKHVFCEKPLTSYFNQAKDLVELAQKNRLCLYTDYIYTVSPSINYVKEKIADIGPILRIEGEIRQLGKFYTNDCVEDVLGVHLISSVIYILGIANDIEVKSYKCIRKQGNNILESEFELSIPSVEHSHFLCSLVSETKTRKLLITGVRGILSFDMLGEFTSNYIELTELGLGYDIKQEKKVYFDESNNVSGALLKFGESIESGNGGNPIMTMAVANVLDKLNVYKE